MLTLVDRLLNAKCAKKLARNLLQHRKRLRIYTNKASIRGQCR